MGLSATLVIVVVLTPLWWEHLREYSLAAAIVVLCVASILWGLYVAELSPLDHRIDPDIKRSAIAHLLSGLALTIVVLWGRRWFPLHHVAVLYGAGALVASFIDTGRSWKFELVLPLTILVVGAGAALETCRAAERQATTLVTFMSTLAFWHMAFGPIWSNWPDVGRTLGLSLLPKDWLKRHRDDSTGRQQGSGPVGVDTARSRSTV